MKYQVTDGHGGTTREAVISSLSDARVGHITAYDDHLLISVAEDYDIDALIAILPLGATADWAGSSNTNACGDTTEDIRVTWSASR